MMTDLRQKMNKSEETSYRIILEQQISLAIRLTIYFLPSPAFITTLTNPATGQHKELAEFNSNLHNSLYQDSNSLTLLTFHASNLMPIKVAYLE
jgi:hypothetical protein